MAQIIKPAVGEKTYRMSDDTLKDENKDDLPATKGNVVNFKVGFDKDFKGDKFDLKEGAVHKLHVLHAEALESKGYGKIQK